MFVNALVGAVYRNGKLYSFKLVLRLVEQPESELLWNSFGLFDDLQLR